MKRLSLLFGLLLAAVLAFAQDGRTVRGSVTDESGEPLIGASVLVKGTTVGTVTDLDGNFELTTPTDDATLVVSYIGYSPRTLQASQITSTPILMSEGAVLTEVVVTGTGVATDRRRTAIAVETVPASDLQSFPSGSIDAALVGKVPGARFQQSSGQPGQQANIVLRGINSLQGTTPMILIDGVEVLTDNVSNGSARNLSSRLADIDFSNVESVEVVQGAAAATIYGAQGANGVIQIFTKRGVTGQKPRISVGTQYTTGEALRGDFEYAQSHAYRTGADGFLINSADERLGTNDFGVWGEPLLETGKRVLTDNPYQEQLFDRFDQVFRQFNAYRVNAAVSGGTKAIGYSVSGAFTNQESAIFGANERLNLNSSINFELFKDFDVRFGVGLVRSSNDAGTVTGTDNVTAPLGSVATTFPFIDFNNLVNGQPVPNPAGDNSANPVFEQQYRLRDNRVNRVNPRLSLDYGLNDKLSFQYVLGYDYYRDDYRETLRNQESIIGSSNQAGIDPFQGRLRNFARQGDLLNSKISGFLTLGEEDGISSSSQVAFDYRRRTFNRIETEGVGLPFFEPVRLGSTGSPQIDEYFEEFATYGVLVNSKLEYKGMVGIGAGIRADWASTFGQGSDAFVFPRVNGYARLSEMGFFEGLRESIPEFKIRAAYGQAGIQPDALARFPVLQAGQFGSAGYLSPAIALNNPLLGVQTSTEIEVGADLVFTLTGEGSTVFPYGRASLTYWTRDNEDIIRAIGVAPSTGSSTLLTNAITLEGQGIQAQLDLQVLDTEDFKWNFTTNFGRSTTTIGEIQGGVDIPVDDNFILREGEELGTFRGQPVVTSYEQLEEILGEAADRGRYVVVPESGYIVDTTTFAPVLGEVTTIGNGLPDFTMSFINNFTFHKGIKLGFQLDWVKGFDIYNQTRQWTYRDNLGGDVDDPVTIAGETGAFLNYYRALYNTNQANSHFVEDGSFLRLRNLTLGVDLVRYVEIPGIRTANLTFAGFNLFTLTDYSGFDPEAASDVNDPTRIGLDEYAFPNSRLFQVGLNLGF